METQVAFQQFIQALKDMGADVHGAAFLSDPHAAWAAVDPALRAAYLLPLGIEDGPEVKLKIGKKPGSKKSLENVIVTISGPEIPPAPPRPDLGVVPAGSPPRAESPPPEPAAAAAPAPTPDAAPMPEPAREAAPEPAMAAEAAAPEPAPEPTVSVTVTESKKSKKQKRNAKKLDVEPEPTPEPAPASAASVEPQAALEATLQLPEPAPPAEAPAPVAKKSALKGMLGLLKRNETKAEKYNGVVTDTNKPLDAGYEVSDLYPVQEPYAYIRIVRDVENHTLRYDVLEPELSEREQNILQFIENTIIDIIEVGLSTISKESAAEMLRKHVDEVIYDYSIVLTPLSREKVLYYILRDFLGFGKLDPMMRDEFIEDISCDGPGIPIFLYHRKHESIKSSVVYPDPMELDSYVIKMAQRSGKHVSIAEPLLDATLPDGSRLNATLSDEVTDGGSTFTIRKFREDPFTIPDLIRFGTMNEELLAYWWLAVQNGASAIYAGGTASGKTTSLNAILLFIPPQMKIVSIEDTREINIPHENWIAGVTRAGFGPRDNNGRQAGEIDMFSLLKAALRQRPEYILVGEVRGQEATALFQAMATGHTAYGTMHADSTEAVIHRLESEPISIPRSLLEALDIVSIQIQTRIGERRVRRTKELVEIVGLDPHTREILTNEVFTWSPATDEYEFSGVSYVLERIQLERNMNESDMKEEFERRKRIIHWMVEKDIRALDEVGRVIATYYRNPDAIMALVEAGKGVEGLLEAKNAQ